MLKGSGTERKEAMLEFVTSQLRVASAAANVYPETAPAVDEAVSPR
jgi:hypothetical protein